MLCAARSLSLSLSQDLSALSLQISVSLCVSVCLFMCVACAGLTQGMRTVLQQISQAQFWLDRNSSMPSSPTALLSNMARSLGPGAVMAQLRLRLISHLRCQQAYQRLCRPALGRCLCYCPLLRQRVAFFCHSIHSHSIKRRHLPVQVNNFVPRESHSRAADEWR